MPKEGIVSETIKQKMVRYAELKNLKEAKEKEAAANNEEMKTLLGEIKEGMEAQEVTLVRVEGVGRYQLEYKTFIGVLAEDKPKALAWLAEQPQGADLIFETYKEGDFSKLMEEIVDKNQVPPPFVKVTNSTVCKLVRAGVEK